MIDAGKGRNILAFSDSAGEFDERSCVVVVPRSDFRGHVTESCIEIEDGRFDVGRADESRLFGVFAVEHNALGEIIGEGDLGNDMPLFIEGAVFVICVGFAIVCLHPGREVDMEHRFEQGIAVEGHAGTDAEFTARSMEFGGIRVGVLLPEFDFLG